MSRGASLLRAVLDGLVSALGSAGKKSGTRSSSQHSGATDIRREPSKPNAIWRQARGGAAGHAPVEVDASPGQIGAGATRDLTPNEIARLTPAYAPQLDGEPDPGEVVWTWVPYVENDGRGKDRPVLIIARVDGESWAACYLSTKQHRGFVSVGSGSWDSKGRESFLSPERVLRVTDSGMRRESTGIGRDRFERAVEAVLAYHRTR